MNPTVCIAGAGSVGCYIGAHLIRSGIPVFFLGRERIQKDLLQHGLHITNLHQNNFSIDPKKISYFCNPKEIPDFSIIIFTVKSMDTDSIANSIKEKVSSITNVISLQNGVKNPDTLRKIFTNANVFGGMIPYNILYQGKGKFHCGTSGELVLEEKGEISFQIQKIFREANLSLKLSSQINEILWGKLIFNLNNPLNALAGIPLKEELQNRDYRLILANCMQEALHILKIAKIRPKGSGKMIPSLAPHILKLPNFLFQRVASSMLQIDPEARSSMWEDLQNKRKTEIDYLNGEIVSLGSKHNVHLPFNTAILRLIQNAEIQAIGSPNLTPKKIQEEIFS